MITTASSGQTIAWTIQRRRRASAASDVGACRLTIVGREEVDLGLRHERPTSIDVEALA
jgi:hypothetical protein